MEDIRRVIRLNQQSGLSTRQIAKALNISRSTISDYLQRYKQSGLKLASLDGLNDSRIYASLFPVKTDAEKKHQKCKVSGHGIQVVSILMVNQDLFQEIQRLVERSETSL